MKVPIYCLSSLNLPFITFSAVMELDPVCLSPCSKQHVKLHQQRGLQGYCSEGLLFLALGYISLSSLLQWCMKGRHARVFHAVVMPSVCHPKASLQTQSLLALCTAGLAIANELLMLLFTPCTYLAALAHLYSVFFSCLLYQLSFLACQLWWTYTGWVRGMNTCRLLSQGLWNSIDPGNQIDFLAILCSTTFSHEVWTPNLSGSTPSYIITRVFFRALFTPL